MTWTLFSGLLSFSIVSTFTPGPNNLLALASGANWGYRATLPHIFGVCLGFASMLALVGAGLGNLFKALPLSYTILKYAAFLYLVYLALKIGTSKGIGEDKKSGKPLTLGGSAAFQWVNPKAWIASITIVSSFTAPDSFWPSLLIGAGANIVLAFMAVSSWALFGTAVKAWLSKPLRRQVFNWSMAALLILSALSAISP